MKGCLNPTDAWICGTIVSRDGVVSPHLVFSKSEAFAYYCKIGCPNLLDANYKPVPCGKCAVCQIEKRKHWSTRLAQEASMYESSCFITLTYNDESIPVTCWRSPDDPLKQFDRGAGTLPEYTLLPSDVQKFIKRLRRHLEYRPTKYKSTWRGKVLARDHVSIRYFACGEYGSRTHRPHYHIIIFGWKPSDAKLLKIYKGRPVYTSDQIKSCWTQAVNGRKQSLGFSSFSDVSPFVAKYVARYVTKKMTRLDCSTWNKCKIPEFNLQSVRNGGIGAPWFDKFGHHQMARGFVDYRAGDRILKAAIPPYYWHRLRKTNQSLYIRLRDVRMEFARDHRTAPDFEKLVQFCECERLKDDHFTKQEYF